MRSVVIADRSRCAHVEVRGVRVGVLHNGRRQHFRWGRAPATQQHRSPTPGGARMSEVIDHDRQQLNEMGYAQELKRGMGWFSNFAISFSIISILAGGMTAYWLGMVTGGPRVITLGWLIVGFFALLVGMAMGEICSAYPTAGGLYYWSAKLARKNGATVVVVHGMVQPARPDRGDRQRRLRARRVHRLLHPHVRRRVPSSRCSASSGSSCCVLIAHGLLNTFGVQRDQDPRRHQCVVARRRRGDHLLHPDDRPQQHPWSQLGVRSGAARAHRMDGWGVRLGVPLRARSPVGPVHDHRFRCLGARQ